MRTSIQRAYGVRSFLLSHFYTIVTQRPHACSTTLFFDLLPPFDPSRSRRGAERHVADTGIRIDVFSPTGARLPAGAAVGYDPGGRRRYTAEGRRKAHGSANQIHATIWRARLRAKAVW